MKAKQRRAQVVAGCRSRCLQETQRDTTSDNSRCLGSTHSTRLSRYIREMTAVNGDGRFLMRSPVYGSRLYPAKREDARSLPAKKQDLALKGDVALPNKGTPRTCIQQVALFSDLSSESFRFPFRVLQFLSLGSDALSESGEKCL